MLTYCMIKNWKYKYYKKVEKECIKDLKKVKSNYYEWKMSFIIKLGVKYIFSLYKIASF